ncbi:hypothetical protein [Lactococcus petauri]|uniref:hypothetical protein n=1 Tax=Lactococcus petauri TaxID=1940789 RepID=UPI0020C6C329|nr:hypothetical protein [Lactococcus petauri]
MKKLYAVYRGEAFLDCGTASELAARFDTNLENVYSKVSKERKARSRASLFQTIPCIGIVLMMVMMRTSGFLSKRFLWVTPKRMWAFLASILTHNIVV